MKKKGVTTAAIGAKHDTLMPLLTAMATDFEELAKKKPDGALTKKKVEIVNRLLRDALSVLEGEPMAPYLDLLDEDDVPQNSDVVLILGQFVVAMHAFYDKYYDHTLLGGSGWIVDQEHADSVEE